MGGCASLVRDGALGLAGAFSAGGACWCTPWTEGAPAGSRPRNSSAGQRNTSMAYSLPPLPGGHQRPSSLSPGGRTMRSRPRFRPVDKVARPCTRCFAIGSQNRRANWGLGAGHGRRNLAGIQGSYVNDGLRLQPSGPHHISGNSSVGLLAPASRQHHSPILPRLNATFGIDAIYQPTPAEWTLPDSGRLRFHKSTRRSGRGKKRQWDKVIPSEFFRFQASFVHMQNL